MRRNEYIKNSLCGNYFPCFEFIKLKSIEPDVMKEEISQSINDPEMLEILFRKDKTAFIRDFNEASHGTDTDLVKFWRIRLKTGIPGSNAQLLKADLWTIAILCTVMALMVKSHLLFGNMKMEEFYSRNLFSIVFAGLTAWFVMKNRIFSGKKILMMALPLVVVTIFLNLLPEKPADTTTLAIIHTPVLLWFVFGMAYISLDFRNTDKISSFIRYCGELSIMSGLLLIAGAILSGMTISLFAIIGMKIEQFYMENIAIIGATVIPIVAVWLMDMYPDITRRIAPIIARIFTPLVFILSVVYLIAITISGIELSKNRDVLILFNLLLLGVMVIIVFSLSEIDKSNIRKFNSILLFLLVVVTLIIDLFALTAILTRLSEGFTPNRTVILVSNILFLVNLLLILPDLYLAGFRGKLLNRMERKINRYLPVYFIYSIMVIFIFQQLFS